MALTWGVTVMGQSSGEEKGTLPPLKDLDIVEAPKEVVLKGIEFDGNTVFSDEELFALVKERVGKKTGVEELEAIRKTISQHYFDAQYVNSGAVIDAQDMSNGVLVVRIVEGRLDNINVLNEGWLRSGYVTSRIHREVSDPLNLDDLKRGLEFVRRDEKIRKINTALVPGDELGQSHLDMIVT